MSGFVSSTSADLLRHRFGLRSRPIRYVAMVLALAALLLLLPATALSSSPASSPSPGGQLTYRIGMQSDVDNMNPFSTYMTIPWECFRVGYNFLTWYDANYKPMPDLADPVPTVANGGITNGGRVWTFHLRPNVKWSDGVPLTASDVAYTYNRILRQKLGMYIGYFTNVTKVEATDAHTVVITCSKPNGVLTALYVPILPEHVWSKVPDSKVETWTQRADGLERSVPGGGGARTASTSGWTATRTTRTASARSRPSTRCCSRCTRRRTPGRRLQGGRPRRRHRARPRLLPNLKNVPGSTSWRPRRSASTSSA